MYFDPGTGSLLIQAIIATLAVAGGYFAATKTKLKHFFSKKKDTAEESLPDADENADEDDTL